MQNANLTHPGVSISPTIAPPLAQPRAPLTDDASLSPLYRYPAGLPLLLRLVGGIQIILGLFYLFAPQFFLQQMGHSATASDINYPLGMLAARFIVYGAGFLVAARAPQAHRLWLNNMVAIQLIDLAVGIFYTANGTLSLALSGFPMFNAVWIATLLWLWRPRQTAAAVQ